MYLPARTISRREMLRTAAGGFGAIALAGMLADLEAAQRSAVSDPLAARPAHHAPKAKHVIFLFMSGGVSHVDTFDPKPRLAVDHGKQFTQEYWLGRRNVKRYYKQADWKFKPYGQCGMEVSDLFPHIGGMADDLCLIRSMSTDNENHYEAVLGMHTGSFTFARPSMGSWLSYGLGTENQNLPSFVVLAPPSTYAGAQAWAADFLPGCHQGTHIIPGGTPIANIQRRVASEELQQMELELLDAANRAHSIGRANPALEARIKSFETAFGMQREAPEVFDLSQETDATLALYNLKRGETAGYGWQCLIARRMIERGVRFVECIDTGASNNWDSHGNMQDHAALAKKVDQPIAGLLQDLKARGLLEETLVVWTSEFGRMPYGENADDKGRNHHPEAFSSWLAGAGVKKGIVHGKTDEHGAKVVENRVHLHDFHATILHLLGLDHERLTYRHSGRDFRLTDVSGRVVEEILS